MESRNARFAEHRSEISSLSIAQLILEGGRRGVSYLATPNEGIPNAALSAAPEKILSGHTFWVVNTPRGQGFRPVMYHVARHRSDVLALVLKGQKKKMPHSAVSGQSEFFPRTPVHKKDA